jgi:hypothetical protein
VSVPTNRCARCGRPIEPGEHLCAECREEGPGPVASRATATRERRTPPELQERANRWPPDMPRPSPVQYHATVMVAVFLALLGIALFAFWSHHGVGPFQGTVRQFGIPPGKSLAVVATVENQGSKTARSTCRISARNASNTEVAGQTVLTPPIPAHGSVMLHQSFPDVTAPPATVTISCS